MKQIELTKDKFAVVDDEDFDWLNQWSWYAQSNNQGKTYAARDVDRTGNRKTLLMHKEILKRMGCVGKFTGDHKNRNPLDNRRLNLRPATKNQDRANASLRSDNTSGFKGVSWNKAEEKWSADITVNQKHKFLGYFDSKIEAARAYDCSALHHFGEFAVLNFPINSKQLT